MCRALPLTIRCPSPLAAEKRLERRLRFLRLEPPLEYLRLLVDPPHDLGGGAADQTPRCRYCFGRQRRDLARGFEGLGLDFTGRDHFVDEPERLGVVGV